MTEAGLSRAEFADYLYRQAYSECVRLAKAIFQLDPQGGSANVLALLQRGNKEDVDQRALLSLVTLATEHRLTAALPYLPPMLGHWDPLRRSTVLICLRQLTGQDFPPQPEPWERWIAESK